MYYRTLIFHLPPTKLWAGNLFSRVCHSARRAVQGPAWSCATSVHDPPLLPFVQGSQPLCTGSYSCSTWTSLYRTSDPRPPPVQSCSLWSTVSQQAWSWHSTEVPSCSPLLVNIPPWHTPNQIWGKKRTRGNNNSTKRLLLIMDSGALLESSYCLWNEDQSLHPTPTSIIKPWWSTNYRTLRSKTAYSL